MVKAMNEAKNPFELMIDAVRQAVREEVKSVLASHENGRSKRKDWVRAEELSEIYDLPKRWFEDRGREGKIQRTKPGRYVLFYRPDVDRFLHESMTGGKA
jgi:hypothetical protein